MSSIDTEGHKTYQGIYAAGASDFHLHKLDFLSKNPGSSSGDGYDDIESKPKKEEQKPQQNNEVDYSIAHAGGSDDFNNYG